jgi:hypothetical protein
VSIDHRAVALKQIAESHDILRPNDEGHCEADRLLAEAQVHATLARDEDHVATTRDLKDVIALLRRRERAMRDLVSQHIAKALASREADRWKAALDLTKALDEAECNMDDLVDARLSDDGWDPRSAYKAPASLVPADDPWAATPDITSEIPEPVRRVIAGHLAEMLLGNQSEDVHQWARGVAFELKRVGADITPDIEKRIRELTLGRDPSDPPF